MTDTQPDQEQTPIRAQVSAAVDELGWRLILGTLQTSVAVASLQDAADLAARMARGCGEAVDGSLSMDVQRTRLMLTLQATATARVTQRELDLARRISQMVLEMGLQLSPALGTEEPRSVQAVEVGIDALDIALVRPFWMAVLGYVGEAGDDGPQGALVDPLGRGPAIWFQQMDQPRPQRNRLHLDVSVPHDEAALRIRTALDAGGVLLSETEAPAFWVLADAEGNEACVTTWQGRD